MVVDSFDGSMSCVFTFVPLIGLCSFCGLFLLGAVLVVVDGFDGAMSCVVTLMACPC